MRTFKTALITGANSGLGFEAAAQLAQAGSQRVILACRNPEKAARAKAALEERTGTSVFEVALLDVSEVDSALALASRLEGAELDLLLLNASSDSLERRRTDAGFEHTLAANLVGHHALTLGLLQHDAFAAGARIVMSTSEVVRTLRTDHLYDYDRMQAEAKSAPNAALSVLRGDTPARHSTMSAYANAKLWAIWWTAELAARLPEHVSVFAVSPGSIPSTRSPATLPWPARLGYYIFRVVGPWLGLAWTVEEGARQYLLGATRPPEDSGAFLGAPPNRFIGELEVQTDEWYDKPEWRTAVWDVLTTETGVTIPSEQRVAR